MSLIGNIIWLIFGGFITGIGYIVGGLAVCLTIIGIPFGWQAIKLGFATMTPFGKDNVVLEDSSNLLTMIFNVLWAVLFGWEIALSHLIHGLILLITIIGIPFAQQHFKLVPMALFPFGRELR
ncbi:MAG: YccF domain-containing protein [Cyanobacteria bacterium J06592_8]|nr:YccF domain-containing protein [Cyanobacteriota bacterium]